MIFFSFFSIGCGIGYGYLHRIPVPDSSVPLKPPMVAPTTAGGFSEVFDLNKCSLPV